MAMPSGSAPGPAAEWRVRGSYFEGCNCEAICPCRSVGGRPGGPSSFGECFGALSWHIHEGHADGVDLSALRTVMSVRYFDRVQPSTRWEVVLYVDQDAERRAAGRAGRHLPRPRRRDGRPAVRPGHRRGPRRPAGPDNPRARRGPQAHRRRRISARRGRGRRVRAGRRPVRHPGLRSPRHRAARRLPAIDRSGAALGGPGTAQRRLRHRLRLPLRLLTRLPPGLSPGRPLAPGARHPSREAEVLAWSATASPQADRGAAHAVGPHGGKARGEPPAQDRMRVAYAARRAGT